MASSMLWGMFETIAVSAVAGWFLVSILTVFGFLVVRHRAGGRRDLAVASLLSLLLLACSTSGDGNDGDASDVASLGEVQSLCKGLGEEACRASDSCTAIEGWPLPQACLVAQEDPAGGLPQFAGCSDGKELDCPLAFAWAHPADQPEEIWLFPDLCFPASWVQQDGDPCCVPTCNGKLCGDDAAAAVAVSVPAGKSVSRKVTRPARVVLQPVRIALVGRLVAATAAAAVAVSVMVGRSAYRPTMTRTRVSVSAGKIAPYCVPNTEPNVARYGMALAWDPCVIAEIALRARYASTRMGDMEASVFRVAFVSRTAMGRHAGPTGVAEVAEAAAMGWSVWQRILGSGALSSANSSRVLVGSSAYSGCAWTRSARPTLIVARPRPTTATATCSAVRG